MAILFYGQVFYWPKIRKIEMQKITKMSIVREVHSRPEILFDIWYSFWYLDPNCMRINW